MVGFVGPPGIPSSQLLSYSDSTLIELWLAKEMVLGSLGELDPICWEIL